ncbi:PIN domain-containing protein [Yersinia enterocolitica]|uniref:PIN domain-containing protein n=1 Tax=Yersinia TaxID=629 RepID=UPI003AB653CE
MRSTYIGRMKKSNDFYKELLTSATIAFDTNVLLSLYRYSDSTRNEFISVLNEIKNRVLLPYFVGTEFFNNRTKVISDQCKAYDETKKKLQEIKLSFDNKRSHPFISEDTSKTFGAALEKVIIELESNNKSHDSQITNDTILDIISEIFDGKVSENYFSDTSDEIIKKGEERYKNKIPPGYEDASKTIKSTELSPHQKIAPYGDLIIWLQLIEYAKNKSEDIIFITDDTKEDWYESARGKVIGPRYELIEEFTKETGKNIHIYQSDKFLSEISSLLQKAVSPETVEEVRETKEDSINERVNYINKNLKWDKELIDTLKGTIKSSSHDSMEMNLGDEYHKKIRDIIKEKNNATQNFKSWELDEFLSEESKINSKLTYTKIKLAQVNNSLDTLINNLKPNQLANSDAYSLLSVQKEMLLMELDELNNQLRRIKRSPF